MSGVGRGLPLLSGPPPPAGSNNAEIACRKCNKEFNVIFARLKRCNHCGYAYCQSCTDYQALMPRDNGYDPMSVCGFCIDYLTVTSAGRAQLKSMPMTKLRSYISAYNIPTDRVVEKDDLIDAIVKARGPNGCLPPENEAYYRRFSVPNKVPPNRSRGFFSGTRHGQASSATGSAPLPPPHPRRPEFARPDLSPENPPPPPPQHTYPRAHWSQGPPQEPSPPPPPPPPPHRQQRYYSPPTHPPPTPTPPPPPPPPPPQWQQQQYPPPPHPPPRPNSSYAYEPPHQAPHFSTPPPPNFTSNRSFSGPTFPSSTGAGGSGQSPPQANRPPRPTTPQPPRQPPAPPSRPRAASTVPPPSLDQLLTMPHEAISSLSIGALKSILFTNHVTVTNILEKGDLVRKVLSLVEDEKVERERQRQAEEMEEMERMQREMDARDASFSTRERRGRENEPESNRFAYEEINAEASMQDGRPSGEYSQGSSMTAESVPPPTAPPPPPPKVTPHVERTGLCIVCQDEEANIAIVDCGHLAMCRSCSELVMASSRECPLCRTRIVTEARLLRIFKT